MCDVRSRYIKQHFRGGRKEGDRKERERETGKEAEEGRERGGERTNFQFIFSHKRPSHPPTPAPDHPRKKKKHPQFMNKYTVPVN